MTKVQIVEHDIDIDGLLPSGTNKPIGDWLVANGLTFVRSIRVADGRIKGVRYSTEDGRPYMWHVGDHTPHYGGVAKDTCSTCTAGDTYETAWEMFDVALKVEPPIVDVPLSRHATAAA